MSGRLEKLKILAFSDPQFTRPVAGGTFLSVINPEKYSFQYTVEQNEDQAPGTSGSSPRFNRTVPETLTLDFVFDRSGIIAGFEALPSGIVADLELFKKTTLYHNGEIHRPNYLLVLWGTLLFKCTLASMNIDYKLFKPNGVPIRSHVNATFKKYIEDEVRVAEENNQSPDLTHFRLVNEGDSLPLMCYRIYGDSKYYLEVAKANNLSDFRDLKPGQQLFFPPFQKQSK